MTDLNSRPAEAAFDSTQLLKEIRVLKDNGNGEIDSLVEAYTYDTINRKITAIISMLSSPRYTYSVIYNYNTDSLLTEIAFDYPASYPTRSDDWTAINFTYDIENIPKQIVFNYIGISSFTIDYTKTIMGTGYRLISENPDKFVPGLIYRTVSAFNENNQCERYEEDEIMTNTAGDRIDSSFTYIDSIVYTSSGDLQKVYRNYNSIPGPPPPQSLYCEFGQRYDKGDQLAKQRKLLFRGVDNLLQDVNLRRPWFYTSAVNAFYDMYSSNQFSSFPSKTSMLDFNGSSPENFIHEAKFDSLDRLTYYHIPFYLTLPQEWDTWELSYYK